MGLYNLQDLQSQLFLCLNLFINLISYKKTSDIAKITFMNFGNSDCILINTAGRVILVDTSVYGSFSAINKILKNYDKIKKQSKRLQ